MPPVQPRPPARQGEGQEFEGQTLQAVLILPAPLFSSLPMTIPALKHWKVTFQNS